MELKILLPHEIRQPRSGLIEETNEKDWILGAPSSPFPYENLFPDQDIVRYITEFNDIQRNNLFDQFCCVLHGIINAVQAVVNKKYGIVLDLSKRDLALRTGVVPRQGTSIRAGAETLRTGGCALEKDYPSLTPTMTEKEFFTPLQGVKEYFLANGYEFYHVNLPPTYLGATMESIIDKGLTQSGVIVAIEGSYSFDEQGRLKYTGLPYSHVVLVVKSEPDHFLVLDSENPNGLMKVRRDYNFSSPKVINVIKKKVPMYKLYKKNGQSAIAVKHWAEDSLIAFASGTLPGGDLFKSLYNIKDYSELERVNCDEWPFPIKFLVTTTEFSGASIINE